MKPPKRYEIVLNPSWEVGIRCVYVEVKTKTRSWSNGPILTDFEDFSVLAPGVRRTVTHLTKKYGDVESLLENCEEGIEESITPMDVRLVVAGCETNRRYLYVSTTNEFMSEADLIAYAKEGEE